MKRRRKESIIRQREYKFRQREYNKKMTSKQRLHRLLRQRPKDESSESKGPGKVW